jgi:hypothetical protein
MKALLFAALLASIATPARADFEGVIEMRITSAGAGGANGKGKTFVSKVGWRSEMEMTSPEMAQALGNKPFRTVMMAKTAAPDTVYTLNDAMKTYAVIDAKQMRDQASKFEKGEKPYTVKRQGKDSVAGLACEKVLVREQGGTQETQACLAKDLMGGEWARSFQRDGRSAGWMKALKDAGVEGFPVRMVTTDTQHKEFKTTMEVTRLERRVVPKSMFELPAGYTQTSAMGAFAQNPEQAKQMEQAQQQMREAMKDLSPEQRKMMEELMKKAGGAPK